MSLKVGTLVMLIQSNFYPEDVGKIGEIVEGLRMRTARTRLGFIHSELGYLVFFPGDPSNSPSGAWSVGQHQVIPITPPGDPVDVKEDQEITA